MSVVRPEFGPTLPELLGPRLRVLPRPVRLALAALAALVVVVAAWALLLRGGGELPATVVRKPIAFNFAHRAPMHRQAPQGAELARVAGNGQSFAVSELRLPAYRGDSAGVLPVLASRVEDQMARELPGFVARTEGRANINKFQGYQVIYQYRPQPGGKLVFGRRIFLLPEPTARQGVDITLTARRTPAIARADAVGNNGPLKTSLRSFRFGTERP
jgi:hypothetical protein